MSKYINEMDEEVKDRFKTLRVLADQCDKMDDDMQVEVRQLDVLYNELYVEIDEQRSQIINGNYEMYQDLLEQFNVMAKQQQQDPKFKDIMAAEVDLQATLKSQGTGVKNFWLTALLNHPNISKKIQEHDKKLLVELKDIRITLHQDYGFGFDIAFYFPKDNDFFLEDVLIKKFVMGRPNVIEKVEATKINWREDRDPTIKKVKKKRKGKRVTVNVGQPSFFSFFDPIRMPEDEDLKEGKLKVTRQDVEKDTEAT